MKFRAVFGHVGWSTVEYLAYPLAMLLTAPIFVRALGQSQFGEWMMFVALTGLGGLAGMGAGAATVREVATLRSSSRVDTHRLVVIVQSSVGLSIVGSIAVASSLLLAWHTWGTLSTRSGLFPAIDSFALLIACVIIVVEQIDSVYAGALRGLERLDLSARVEVLARMVSVAAFVAVALIFQSVDTLILAMPVASILRLALRATMLGTQLSWSVTRPGWDPAAIARLFSFGKWTWLQTIGSALFGVVDRLIVGTILGPTELAKYTIAVQVCQPVQTIPSAGAAALYPLVARLSAGKDGLINVSSKASALVLASASIIAAVLLLGHDWVTQIWLAQPSDSTTRPTTLALIIVFLLLAGNAIPHYLLLGVGRARELALASLAGGVACLAMTWPLVIEFGIAGAALAKFGYCVCIIINIRLAAVELRLSN